MIDAYVQTKTGQIDMLPSNDSLFFSLSTLGEAYQIARF